MKLNLKLKLAIACSLAFFMLMVYICFVPIDFQGESIILNVPPGKTFYELAEDLEEQKLIRKSLYFKLLVRLYNLPVLQVGEYNLSQKESLWTQFQKIRQGKIHYIFITFAEGLNHYEIGEILKNYDWPEHENFLKLITDKTFIKNLLKKDLPSLEGYLFPETYDLSKHMTAKVFLTRMVENFFKNYSSILKTPSSFSRHEIVTFASLIEKETGVPQERPLISSVFHNRLKKNMKLQTDPTILYSLYLKKGFSIEKNIRKQDILSPSPYNTYVIYGLPKGPIANPGKESLQAVLQPASTKYFYFVSRNDGTHVFSENYAEHKKQVYKYQILPFKK